MLTKIALNVKKYIKSVPTIWKCCAIISASEQLSEKISDKISDKRKQAL